MPLTRSISRLKSSTFIARLLTSSNLRRRLASAIISDTKNFCSSSTISRSRRDFSSASKAETALLVSLDRLLLLPLAAMLLYLMDERADSGGRRPVVEPLTGVLGELVRLGILSDAGVVCLRIFGRDFKGNMWRWRKLLACWYIACCSFCCVGELVGISRIRRAATLYCAKESISRLRTLDASAIWADDGGRLGSLVQFR